MPTTISIIGAGAWGTALAVHLAPRLSVRLYARDAAQRQDLSDTRENRRYLPHVPLPAAIAIVPSVQAAVQDAQLAIIATPTGALPEALRALPAELPMLWLCKGFIGDDRQGIPQLPHRYVESSGRSAPCGVLSGPSFALEVAQGLPTALTLASPDSAFAKQWASELRDATLRIYSSHDIVGVEVGGAVKNVLAIAAGISDGLGFGANARAALITRGLAEMGRLSHALGGQRETLMGLAGLGDLVLTCTGELSRNRRVGLELAAGKALATVLALLGHVAEGVPAARAVHALAHSLKVEMPICEAVHQVLYEHVEPRVAVTQLLEREPGHEHE
jgi:glycerol-3-phosphate dehydrogenase (NAD(P)+)